MNKKKIALLIICLFVMGILLGCSNKTETSKTDTSEKKKTIYVKKGSSAPGGVWHPASAVSLEWLAQEMADVADVRSAVVPGGGSDNPVKCGKGEVDLAWTQGPFTYEAYRGLGNYDKAYTDICLVASFQPTPTLLIVAAESDIHSWKDLGNKRIGMGVVGFGSQVMADRILSASYGYTPEVIKKNGGRQEFVDQNTMVDMLKNRQIDAMAWTSQPSNSLIKDLDFSIGVRLVGMPEDDAWKKFFDTYPMYVGMDIEALAGGLKNQKDKIRVPAQAWQIIANRNTPDEIVYNYLKGIEKHLEEWKKVGAGLELTTLEIMASTQEAPFHPGAIKFYKEKNIPMGELKK